MPHVRIKRFASGDREHDRAENGQCEPVPRFEKSKTVHRIDGAEYVRFLDDVTEADQSERAEPDTNDRTEQVSDTRSPLRLKGEQGDEDRNADRHEIGVERWAQNCQSLYRTEDGDRGGDESIAGEQRNAEQRDADDESPTAGG